MKNNKEAVKMVVTLTVIAMAVAFIMSFVNKMTAPVIEQNAQKSLNESLNAVIVADEFNVIDKDDSKTVYEALNGGKRAGLCVINTGTGYGGDIQILTWISNDKKVTGIVILSHGETPGLGANAEKKEFTDGYKNKSYEIKVNKNQASENEIKAISGATVTSKGVTNAVNEALKLAENY